LLAVAFLIIRLQHSIFLANFISHEYFLRNLMTFAVVYVIWCTKWGCLLKWEELKQG
jgi:hypothetical protein